MKRTPIQQMREELLSLVNNYFDRAEARIKQRNKRLQQQRPAKALEPTENKQVDPSQGVIHEPESDEIPASDPELKHFIDSMTNK